MENGAAVEYIQAIQIGFTATRQPVTGEFLPAYKLYIEADDSANSAEEQLIKDVGRLLAQRMKAYKEGCREAGVTV